MFAKTAPAADTSDHFYPVWAPEAVTLNADLAAAAGRFMRMVAPTAQINGHAGYMLVSLLNRQIYECRTNDTGFFIGG
jgi:hypothetical protein